MNYHNNLVSLPSNFGSEEYYERQDIQAILETVKENLELLNSKINFIEELREKKIILKPNLVTVFYKTGFEKEAYPETTDPRVIDAIIQFIKPHAKEIIIAESSGRGMPTRASFHMSGLHRLAEDAKISLLPLEEQPVSRYKLPKAQVMREIYIPQLFDEVVCKEAFYISVPKMKTNLYTQVTLGFKNAMGVIPYNLRQRNHNYRINEKLVDMLYLFKPNLTIIDGIIGGEGNTPAPVDPVESHLIISGNNPVETDRVTTRIMGINPNTVKLISHATDLGFGDPHVSIIGPTEQISFRQADPSLLSEQFQKEFPNVTLLVGHRKNDAPHIKSLNKKEQIKLSVVQEIEQACVGGCLASVRTGLDYIKYMGHPTDFPLVIIIGEGIKIEGQIYYFDKKGEAYSSKDIAAMPHKKLAMGTCTFHLKEVADLYIHGCMPKPIDPVFGLFSLLDLKNYFFKSITQ